MEQQKGAQGPGTLALRRPEWNGDILSWHDAGLSASAAEALKQIEDKHYDTDMKDRGIKEIVKYGIAFAGKNVEIAKG